MYKLYVCYVPKRKFIGGGLKYWWPRRITLTHNTDGTKREAVYRWICWNFQVKK